MLKARSMTPAQVAAHLQVSEHRVVKWLREGQLLGVRTGKKWRTSTLHLAVFLQARANQAATAKVQPGALQKLARKRKPKAKGVSCMVSSKSCQAVRGNKT